MSVRSLPLLSRALSQSVKRSHASQRHLVRAFDKTVSLANGNRFITTSSWAADKLKESGEKLESGGEQGFVEVSPDLFSTPSPKVQKLVDEVLSLNMVEVNQLIKSIQKKLGLNDDMMMFGGGGGGGGGGASAEAAAPVEPVKEKEHFDVKLTVVDAKAKIKIIKEVRTITGLGLKEAKDLVERAPCVIKDGLKKEEAEALKKVLVEAGAQVEII